MSAPVIPNPPFNPLSRSTSTTASNNASSFSSGISPTGKRKRNFKLGSKIDAWWSTVRTSFTTGGEEERVPGRREGSSSSGASMGPPLRTRSFGRSDATGSKPPLRSTTSTQDLSPTQKPPTTVKIPAGASAIADPKRISPPLDTTGPPPPDSRRRNPNLSLKLGPSFNMMKQSPEEAYRARTAPPLRRKVSLGSDDLTPSSQFISPPIPRSSASFAPPSLAGETPGPTGFTPFPQSPGWARTPAFVLQSEAIFPVRPRAPPATETKATGLSAFSMNSVRQHIKLRLATAKENCDKELSKIVLGITAHVEAELQRDDLAMMDPTFDDVHAMDLPSMEAFPNTFDMDSESEVLVDVDASEDLQHTDSESGTSRPPSRSRSLAAQGGREPVAMQRRSSLASRPRTDSPRRISLAPRSRQVTSIPRQGDYLTGHGPPRNDSWSAPESASASSSRSNSRSRSPLPPHTVRNLSAAGSHSPARSSTPQVPLTGDLAQSPFILLLQEIIMVAAEILDTSIVALTARPGGCAEYIQRVQRIGKAWDENPALSCRGWYVQLLLAVAGLSRVVEWWEAEKGFWTFDDTDEADAEPILFVAKPPQDEPSSSVRSPGSSELPGVQDVLSPTTKFSPLGIDLGPVMMTPSHPASPTTVKDAEDLRLTVEAVRSQTLLMELSLDGQLFQYLSSAWGDLVGYVVPSERLL